MRGSHQSSQRGRTQVRSAILQVSGNDESWLACLPRARHKRGPCVTGLDNSSRLQARQSRYGHSCPQGRPCILRGSDLASADSKRLWDSAILCCLTVGTIIEPWASAQRFDRGEL